MTVLEKCEQYWNESNISDEEIHAVLGWIYNKSEEELKQATSEALESAIKVVEKYYNHSEYKIIKEIRALKETK